MKERSQSWEDTDWYGVRTIYEHTQFRNGQDRCYEERIVLVRAANEAEAMQLAEREASEYSTGGTEVLDFVTSFRLFYPPGEGAEVFSLMRDSRMSPSAYVTHFFDTGRERSADLETNKPEPSLADDARSDCGS